MSENDLSSNEETEYDLILDSISKGENVMCHGPGGTGKSYTLRNIARTLHAKNIITYITATTGIAAVNLSDFSEENRLTAQTLHKFAGLQLAEDPIEILLTVINKKPQVKKRWRETQVLIIDEISMLSASFFDKLDAIARFCKHNNKPFGGIQLILSGDFLQLPPVNEKWVFFSNVWEKLDVTVIPFILPKRYPDEDFFHLLLRTRKAQLTMKDVTFLESRKKAYDDYQIKLKNDIANKIIDKSQIKPTILYSTRAEAEAINSEELKKCEGFDVRFDAIDTYECYNGNPRKIDYQKFMDDAIPPLIILRVGAQVILKTNLDVEKGLANGTKGIVTEIFSGGMVEGVRCKWENGEVSMVTRASWSKKDKEGFIEREQIPLILAWALTIHKCQGMTLNYAICDLGPTIFAPGQAYVALSRVRKGEGLLLKSFSHGVIKTDPDAMVYVSYIEN